MKRTSMHEPSGERPVAQVSNLLYRRFPIGRTFREPARSNTCSARGLEIRDTADWKSALRSDPRRASVAQVSNLLYRRLPIGRTFREPPRTNTSSACGLQLSDTA